MVCFKKGVLVKNNLLHSTGGQTLLVMVVLLMIDDCIDNWTLGDEVNIKI